MTAVWITPGGGQGRSAAQPPGTRPRSLWRCREGPPVQRDDTIVLFNTSTGLKYLECYGG